MNPRWESNKRLIEQLERSMDRKREQVVSLDRSDAIQKAKVDDLLDEINDLYKEIENLKRPFKELVKEALEDLRRLYLDESDKRDWSVAWSGGKDSTCVMGLVVAMLEGLAPEERWRKVHAVMSDTMMENPNLESYMHEQVDLLKSYAERKDLPVTAQIVTRPVDQSYFYLVLGRGYFLPQNNGAGRWCTARLKIRPQKAAMKAIDPSFILMGVRLSESAKRKASIKTWSREDKLSEKIGEHAEIKSSKTFMPIVDFTIEDVWMYLQRERLGWSSTHKVRTLYREATGECGFTNPKGTEAKASTSESCGARFGCWNCPVILKDKSTEEMSKSNDWMKPLIEWRFLQLKVMGDYKPDRPEGQSKKERGEVLRVWERIGQEIKLITKSGHKMNGTRMVDRKTGEPRDDQGTVTIEARQYLFEKLIETEQDVNALRVSQGLEPIELISEQEARLIVDRWDEDAEQRPWLKTNIRGTSVYRIEELLALGRRETARIQTSSDS
ncbi:phosphoadenosine phosphosulfate reductase domain-containing protein [Rossellomorea marisflavi]|uniref:phosphoadenosine phosphosulfate reductase domain-containing protein n=1 Tax=Rossellomorea marisflavi TaxID=189381 RepID=UPI0009A5B38D|nr:phosphoadenosine phosphosulfate reductase family protein [Rossellomorea marisflavi]